eukprot:SAG11_NODE_34744_length_270_cov_0.883041_1_plen_31_part_01
MRGGDEPSLHAKFRSKQVDHYPLGVPPTEFH